MSRLFQSLQFKISMSLFLVGVILIGISALRLNVRSQQSRKMTMTSYAFAEGSRLSGMSQHLLRRQVSRAADLELSYSSTNKDLRMGVIIDGQDLVRHATMQQMRGQQLQETPLAKAEVLLEEVRATMEGRVVELQPGKSLMAVFPFWEGLEQGKGCVILEYDLEIPLASATAMALHALLAQSMALMGGCLALWLLLKKVVTERVENLVCQVQGMSLETEPMPAMQGKDELAQVSQAVRLTHERLRRSEQRLRQIAATMRDVFWLAPVEKGSSAFVNEAYTTVFSRAIPRLGKYRWDWLNAIVPEDRRRCLEMLRTLRQGGPRQEIEVRVATPDGHLRWVRCRGFAVPGPNEKEPCAVAGIAMDVSERKTLERRLLDTAENERRRIGMDLHDDLCQRLAAALMKTGVLQSALTRAGGSHGPLATELANDLSEATGIARGFARGLAPVGVEALGITAALSDLGDFITHGFKIPCRVECSATDTALTGESATHIFRVAQELATNAAKHASATWIEISFEMTHQEARLLITHDGVPYKPTTASVEGMGMHLVRQRLDALGASLQFHPPAHGEEPVSSVECLIPLSTNPEIQTAEVL
ncbi:PAS domain S-box-containing protein [Prosthecobacter fusiformis]|uniref:PAS domain S-box-containing protein n=1 Tax=Prosthecobacter fusiformis TaxID=48464 RepID=A0A4R7S203_9BACT|nr:PAS domain S-box protein [Prosthecobacter fusiformis]TDU71458.1 PAS domain S-box-containing protein [Prosthecobacter fusiformis]